MTSRCKPGCCMTMCCMGGLCMTGCCMIGCCMTGCCMTSSCMTGSCMTGCCMTNCCMTILCLAVCCLTELGKAIAKRSCRTPIALAPLNQVDNAFLRRVLDGQTATLAAHTTVHILLSPLFAMLQVLMLEYSILHSPTLKRKSNLAGILTVGSLCASPA